MLGAFRVHRKENTIDTIGFAKRVTFKADIINHSLITAV